MLNREKELLTPNNIHASFQAPVKVLNSYVLSDFQTH